MGGHVVRQLSERGHEVVALVRTRPLADDVSALVRKTHRADALVPGSLAGCFDDAEVVFSCVGASVSSSFRGWSAYGSVDVPANRNLIQGAVAGGVRRFVYTALAHGESLPQVNYVRAHETVVHLVEESTLEGCIVRPTGFFSAFEEFLMLARRGVIPIFGDGSAKTNPIADEDVARACVQAIEGTHAEIPCGGPDVFTRAEVAKMAIEATGKGHVLRLPAWLGRLGTTTMWPLHPRLAALSRFLIEASVRDLVAPSFGTARLVDHFRARA
jgi:uncharacterized protein YbjT (DUF2867 family)